MIRNANHHLLQMTLSLAWLLLSSLNDLSAAKNKLKLGKGFNHVHTLHHKPTKSSFRNLLGKFMNKILSHTYILPAILNGRIQ